MTAEERLTRLKIDLLVDLSCREDVISDRNILHEDALQFCSVGSKDLVLLESL